MEAGCDRLRESTRALVRQYSDLGMWTAALYWADKTNALGGGRVDDEIVSAANCMLRKGEHRRAAHAITSRGLHRVHLLGYYVACRALLEAREYREALRLLDEADPERLPHASDDPPRHRVLAAVSVVRGGALGATERRTGAGESFLRALRRDVFCYEALDYIARHRTLAPHQEVEFLASLPFEAQCDRAEAAALRALYASELDGRGGEEGEAALPPELGDCAARRLAEHSADAIEARARRLARRGDFEACLRALGPPEGDGERAAELRTACLAELRRAPALFSLAHRLVDENPQSATSWFAVGCYYYVTGKSEFARRYLSKATTLDRGMGAAWLAYGHSFAADNEHDQAMAAYFKASQLMSGCHLPLLYVGLECGLTNNPIMADKFFRQALLLAPDDAHVTHEMGAIAFQNQQYEEAERLWRAALERVDSASNGRTVDERWQPLLNNLGHACRKNGKYAEAISFHERALTAAPGCGATYAALGLCLALVGRTERAMDAFHASLSKRPDDTIATTMLTYLVDQLAEQAVSDEDVPEFPFPKGAAVAAAAAAATPERAEERPRDGEGGRDATCVSDMSMSFDE